MRTALAGIVVVALMSAGGGLGATAKPTLRITDLAPLTVRGSYFEPGERVKLLVNAGKPLARAVKAGPRGRFLARLGVRVDPTCSAAVVQAFGNAGSRAMVDLTRPGCDVRP